MGLIDGLLGNASEIDPVKLQNELAKLLADGESIDRAYQLIRDLIVFTNKRLIFIDKQGNEVIPLIYDSDERHFMC